MSDNVNMVEPGKKTCNVSDYRKKERKALRKKCSKNNVVQYFLEYTKRGSTVLK